MHKINPCIIWLPDREQGGIQQREKVESCREKLHHEIEAVKPLRQTREQAAPQGGLDLEESTLLLLVYPYSNLLFLRQPDGVSVHYN